MSPNNFFRWLSSPELSPSFYEYAPRMMLPGVWQELLVLIAARYVAEMSILHHEFAEEKEED